MPWPLALVPESARPDAAQECVRLRRKGSHRVPYRNNRLTMLLRPSFEPVAGCAARMVLLVTVSPGAADTVRLDDLAL